MIATACIIVFDLRLIFWFVLFAWSGLACAFTPGVLLSLFWRRTTRAGAIAGMAAGLVTAVLWVVLLKSRTYELYEMIPGFAVATIAVSPFTEPPDEAAAEFDEVRRALCEG